MATNPAIETAIRETLKKADSLRKLAFELAAAHGIEIPELAAAQAILPVENQEVAISEHGSRKSMLREFFLKNGPQTRKELLEKTGLPLGTIASLLTRHGKRAGQMKWDWDEEKSDASE